MLKEFLRRSRFRQQLTLIVSAALIGLALVSSLLDAWEASRRMRGYLIGQGLQITESLARQSTLALLYHSPDNASDEVATALAFPDVLHVEIRDTAQGVLLSSSREGHRHVEPVTRNAALPGQPRLEHETDEEWHFSAPVYTGAEEASPFEAEERKPQLIGQVHVVVSKASMEHLGVSLLLVNLTISISFAVVLLALIGFLVQRLIRPLNALSALMRRAEGGESGLRARVSGPRDITDMAIAFNKMMAVLEEREAELQQSRDRAVHTAQMKTQFAATVSHEVRTPLNGVVGMLDLLRETRMAKPQRECVEVAWNSAQALMELINGILDFSKLEAGKLELEEIDFDLRDLVEGVMELLAKQVQQKGLDLGYQLAPEVPVRLRGDSLRLRQVLINLLSNAVKFTERGEIAVRLTGSPEGEDGIRLRIEVSDTGIGMDDATVQHVFDSFAQADPSTTRKYGGTGLGLTISRHLVDLMGGEIGVSSRLGQGSVFWFSIPCRIAAVAPEPAVEKLPPGLRVLMLARNGIVRVFLEQALGGLGVHCQRVGNSRETLDRLQRLQQESGGYALVIVDCDAVDGRCSDLVARIHANGPAPVLLLSREGHRVEHMTEQDLVLAKPLRQEALLSALQHVLAAGAPAMVPADAGGAESAQGSRRFRVLVVEDNQVNQMVAAGMLARSDCHCEFAGNGREAVEAVRRSLFDLILMDCSMPEMDGYEATAHIRAFEKGQDRYTPIVAMTANAQSGDEEACLEAGMDDYLAKPVTLGKLREKLGKWLPQEETDAGSPAGSGG
ncbi:MAG: signaling protein [Moraxellaceae bacterium]|nr:signaling protein [Moraxellaceae bacterium]